MMQMGLATQVHVSRIIDGDTIEVEAKRRFAVRLRGIDVCERNTATGKQAKEYLEGLILDKDVVLFVPSNQPEQLMDINSFNRIVGDIYWNDQNITELLQGFTK